MLDKNLFAGAKIIPCVLEQAPRWAIPIKNKGMRQWIFQSARVNLMQVFLAAETCKSLQKEGIKGGKNTDQGMNELIQLPFWSRVSLFLLRMKYVVVYIEYIHQPI